MMVRCIKIPISLCEYVLIRKCHKQLALYIYLKFLYGERVKLDKNLRARCITDFEISIPTLRTRLRWLIDNLWIGFDPVTKYLHLRGFKRLYIMLDLGFRLAVEFDPDHIKIFRSFIFAAVIIARINRQKWAVLRGRKKARPIPSNIDPFFADYFGLSTSTIANMLNISSATASRWLKIASKQGFLTTKQKFKWISDRSDDYYPYIKAFPEDIGRIKPFKGKLWKQMHNEIIPEMYLTRRSNRFWKMKKNENI